MTNNSSSKKDNNKPNNGSSMKGSKYMLLVFVLILLIVSLFAGGIIFKIKNNAKNNENSPVEQATENQTGVVETKETAEETQQGKEAVVLNVYAELSSYSGKQTGWMADILKQKFGVELNICPYLYSASDSELDKQAENADILIFAGRFDTYDTMLEKGMLLDLEKDDLIHKYGENLETYLAQQLEENRKLNGGCITGISGRNHIRGSLMVPQIYGWDVRWDLYEQLGKPEVKNLDDFVSLMAEMKEICKTDDLGNETYALTMWSDWDDNMMMYANLLTSAYFGCVESGLGFYDAQTREYYDALMENGPYYQSLVALNSLYRKGLIDPVSREQNYHGADIKIQNGQSLASLVIYAGEDLYNSPEHILQNKMMLPLVPAEAKPVVFGIGNPGTTGEYAIGSNTKYPELCIQVIDWIASAEGQLICMYGPKGLCWDYDEDGWLFLTETGKKLHSEWMADMSEYGYSGYFIDGSLQINSNIWDSFSIIPGDKYGQTFYNGDSWKKAESQDVCDLERDWKTYTNANSKTEYLTNRGVFYEEENWGNKQENSTLSDVEKTLRRIIADGSWDCVYADTEEEFENTFREMCELAEAEGYYEVIGQ